MIDDETRRVLIARIEGIAGGVGRLRRRFKSHAQTCTTCAGEGYADLNVWADDPVAGELCRTCRGRGKVNPAAWTGEYVVDRVAGELETLFNIVQLSAAELAAACSPSDEEAADAAVDFVDARMRRFRSLLEETRS